MHDDLGAADEAALALRVDVLDAVGGALPLVDLVLRVRRRPDDAVLVLVVPEQLVRDGLDERLAQVRVADVRRPADELARDVLDLDIVELVVDRDDHGLAARVGLEHVHAVEAERRRVRDRVERGEARDGQLADERAGKETLDELLAAVERREVEDLEARVVVHEVGEEVGERRRVGLVDGLVVRELGALAVGVASALLLGEARLARRHRLEEALLVDEGDLDDRLPLLLLAVHVLLEDGRVEVDDGRRRVAHEVAERGRDVLGRQVGEDTHELLERLEGLAEVEVERHLLGALEVCARGEERRQRGERERARRRGRRRGGREDAPDILGA